MKAIVQHRYGSADVLELRDIARPDVAADEVLVRVHAAGVDRGVWHLMTGRPYLVRLVSGLRGPKRAVPGMDLAGVVEAVGDDVTAFRSGDEVFGIGTGAFAEHATAPARKLANKPPGISFEQAAVLGVSGLTALQAVRDHGRVQPGHAVLIIGASGGVGSYAVQLAAAYGAEVTAVCSGAKAELVRSLGAGHVLDYDRDDVADGSQRYDVIIDIGGNTPLRRLRRALTSTGTLVIVGGEGGGRWLGGLQRQLHATLRSPFTAQKLGTFISSENNEDLATIAEHVTADMLTPVIDRAFSLPEAPKAIRYLEEGHARGKLVVTID